jgi:mannose-1-phosphate guanylyltransferase/phosphomannomutase
MKSVIMAGGEGTRLRPLTANQPKPMLPLGNRPMMEHIVRHVHNHGFKDIVVTVQFLASQVRNYFGDGSDMGVDLTYATETTPLGTAGSVRNAAEQLQDTFLVISGDALTDVDLGELVAFEHIPDGPSDFAGDIFPKLLELGAPLYGFVVDGYWEDVGNLEAYQRAHQDILDGRVDLDIGGFEVRRGVWLGEGAEVDPDARLDGPVLIGDFAKVERDVHLREYSVIGSGVVVKSGAFLHRAIVHDNAYIGQGASLRGCVVGRSADVKRGGRVEDGVVVGDNANIGHGAILQPNVKIYPFKTVEPGATVTKSIIWEGRGARSLFDEHGVSGLANVDVTPELALRVAMAFGSTLKKGSRVTLGHDASRVSRAFKRALVAGLNSTGVTCTDLELAPAPAVRFSATKANASGGMYVRTSPRDSQSIELAIFADDGCDLDEGARRKLERTFNREEFRRAFGREMGELRYPPRSIELYTAALLDAIDVRAVRERGFKLVIDAGGGTSLLVLPHLLPRLGLDTLTVNGQFDEARTAMDPGQVRADLEHLARLVTASGADLGVRFDPVAERLTLVDERGMVVPFDRALLLYVDLVAHSGEPGDVALPVCTTRWAAELAAKHGRAVVGTKLAASALARAAQHDGVVFAGAEGGGYAFPSLHPCYDGLLAFGKLLELLATEETGLSKAVAALPEVGLVRRQVPTPWGRKGAIMRQVVEAAKGRPTDDTDGIKVYHAAKSGSGPDDWVLVIPDTVEPVTHLWAESATIADADELADAYEALVRRAAEGE